MEARALKYSSGLKILKGNVPNTDTVLLIRFNPNFRSCTRGCVVVKNSQITTTKASALLCCTKIYHLTNNTKRAQQL